MLAERGLGQNVAVQIMAILTGTGLLANLACGKLATRTRVVKLLGAGLALLAAALVMFPTIDGLTGARLYAAAIGTSGGIVTVVFFASWGHLFGRAHLGRIQGAAVRHGFGFGHRACANGRKSCARWLLFAHVLRHLVRGRHAGDRGAGGSVAVPPLSAMQPFASDLLGDRGTAPREV